jgi:hypothetical protein
MQYSCQQTKLASDVRCPVCGQGFLIYADQGMYVSREEGRRIIQQALRTHHTVRSISPVAHPNGTFDIPSWSGAPPFWASAFLSNLLDAAV